MMARPQYIGLDLSPLPFESLRSAASRFAWRNGLPFESLKTLYNAALLQLLGAGRAMVVLRDNAALESLTGWPMAESDESSFYQQNSDCGMEVLDRGFRYCPICLEECYHSYLFQWTGLGTCPLHGCALETRCCTCGDIVAGTVHDVGIGNLGYRCGRCYSHIAGGEPNLEYHLQLRAQSQLIHHRMKGLHEELVRLFSQCEPIRCARVVLAQQCRGSREGWGDKRGLVRALEEIVCTGGAEKGVSEVLGVTFIRWRINMEHASMQCASRTWRERVRGLTPTYLATRRALEAWLFQDKVIPDEVQRIRDRFVLGGEGADTLDWNPLELAYALLRFTQESIGFYPLTPGISRNFIQLRDAPMSVPNWDVHGRLPRIAYRAWLLAAFATLHALIKKYRGTSIDRILQLPQLPASIVPTFVQRTRTSAWVSGGVFFPTIEGMPLWPFARHGNHALQPNGSSC